MLESMISLGVGFLVLLNPFALYIYLQPIMRELGMRQFLKVFLRASAISLGIFYLFALSGDFIFDDILQINFESFRLFGGIVLFSFAFMFIILGRKSLIEMREDLTDLASEIALPFMVGAGTIYLSILIGHKFRPMDSFWLLVIIHAINYLIIFIMIIIRRSLTRKLQIAFDKLLEMSLRLNGFFVGAIGVNMIITSIKNMYLG